MRTLTITLLDKNKDCPLGQLQFTDDDLRACGIIPSPTEISAHIKRCLRLEADENSFKRLKGFLGNNMFGNYDLEVKPLGTGPLIPSDPEKDKTISDLRRIVKELENEKSRQKIQHDGEMTQLRKQLEEKLAEAQQTIKDKEAIIQSRQSELATYQARLEKYNSELRRLRQQVGSAEERARQAEQDRDWWRELYNEERGKRAQAAPPDAEA